VELSIAKNAHMNMNNDPKEDVFLEDNDYKKLAEL